MGCYMGIHGVELFDRPGQWSKVMALQSLRESRVHSVHVAGSERSRVDMHTCRGQRSVRFQSPASLKPWLVLPENF